MTHPTNSKTTPADTGGSGLPPNRQWFIKVGTNISGTEAYDLLTDSSKEDAEDFAQDFARDNMQSFSRFFEDDDVDDDPSWYEVVPYNPEEHDGYL